MFCIELIGVGNGVGIGLVFKMFELFNTSRYVGLGDNVIIS